MRTWGEGGEDMGVRVVRTWGEGGDNMRVRG